MNNIEKLIANYRYKHPLAEKLGGEFIMQCDEAQIDAIQLVCDIFEIKQEPCEMTVEEYRQRMMQAFHNADCDELIAVCVPPAAKEFEHLEGLLKNHYKKEPCEDVISRAWLKEAIHNFYYGLKHTPTEEDIQAYIDVAPSVTSQQKTGHWIEEDVYDGDVAYRCSECDELFWIESGTPKDNEYNFCPKCGASMEDEE